MPSTSTQMPLVAQCGRARVLTRLLFSLMCLNVPGVRTKARPHHLSPPPTRCLSLSVANNNPDCFTHLQRPISSNALMPMLTRRFALNSLSSFFFSTLRSAKDSAANDVCHFTFKWSKVWSLGVCRCAASNTLLQCNNSQNTDILIMNESRAAQIWQSLPRGMHDLGTSFWSYWAPVCLSHVQKHWLQYQLHTQDFGQFCRSCIYLLWSCESHHSEKFYPNITISLFWFYNV